VDSTKLFPQYLAAYFSSINFQHQLAAVMSHSARNQAPVSAQRGLKIVVPSLPEQAAIANILSVFDEKIELTRRINETLQEMARAIFKSWFVDFDPVKAKAEGLEPEGIDAATAALFPSEFQGFRTRRHSSRMGSLAVWAQDRDI
jgi:type I restriction enzyme S subunit